jgi:hypothetical protein
MVLKEPLDKDRAQALIHAIAREGDIAWTKHATEVMAARAMSTLDCQNVMRCGAGKGTAGT